MAASSVPGTLSKGERLEVLDQKSDWFHVRTEQGRTGWVSSRYVTKMNDLRNDRNDPANRGIGGGEIKEPSETSPNNGDTNTTY
jgi:uncharacterized protein YgiM (DUF1202 family)